MLEVLNTWTNNVLAAVVTMLIIAVVVIIAYYVAWHSTEDMVKAVIAAVIAGLIMLAVRGIIYKDIQETLGDSCRKGPENASIFDIDKF